MAKVNKVVLPVAGSGKRLRPLTARRPKALVPLNGGPLLDYMLREAEVSGLKEAVLVINPSHLPHFKAYLKEAGKKFKGLKFHVRFQDKPGGNGHAIIQAADLLKNEPFAVRFCDDLVMGHPPVLASLIKYYEAYRAPVILLERVPKRYVSRYAVVGVKKTGPKSPHGKFYEITGIVEKPAARKALSNLTVVGGYVLTPAVLRNLTKVAESLPTVADDALPLAVGLQVELITGGRFYGWEFPGRRFDCGTLQGLKKAERFLFDTTRKP